MRERRRQSGDQLVLDAERLEPLFVDLEPVQLPAGQEIGELARREVERALLIPAAWMLIPQSPVDIRSRGRRCRQGLGVFAALVEQELPLDAVELAVADELAGNELPEPVEQLGREWIRTGYRLGLAEEVLGAKSDAESAVTTPHNQDTRICVSTQLASPRNAFEGRQLV